MTEKEKRQLRAAMGGWNIANICASLTSKGMEFVADKCTDKDLKDHRNICIREITKRIQLAEDL